MTKEQLLDIITRILETDANLNYLSKLSKSELETLVPTVRNKVENFSESWQHLISDRCMLCNLHVIDGCACMWLGC